MKLELSDGMSNNSDFSNDSQNSQMSTADFMISMGSGVSLTPTTTFITLEGLNSGVPTRTTPTLTPTTLRSIEQTFIELQSKPESHENEAGFVPPQVHLIGNDQYISASDADYYPTTKAQGMWQNTLSQSSSDSNTRSTPPLPITTTTLQKTSPNSSNNNNSTPSHNTRRNMGGRKPTKDANISPEEEERRRVRRERNKAAAARCRKRRVDHTNSLLLETEDLESKKEGLQKELLELRRMKDELEFLLESHKTSGGCRASNQSPPDIKPFVPAYEPRTNGDRVKLELIEPLPSHHQHQHQHQQHQHHHNLDDDDNSIFSAPTPAKRIMLSSTVPISKPSRPNSLNVGATAPSTISNTNNNNNNNISNSKNNNNNNNNSTAATCSKNVSDLAGVSITTPSTGIQFNFDSLMVGGTGLTPVSGPLVPSCSTQQRIPTSVADIISPDACGPPKLVSL